MSLSFVAHTLHLAVCLAASSSQDVSNFIDTLLQFFALEILRLPQQC